MYTSFSILIVDVHWRLKMICAPKLTLHMMESFLYDTFQATKLIGKVLLEKDLRPTLFLLSLFKNFSSQMNTYLQSSNKFFLFKTLNQRDLISVLFFATRNITFLVPTLYHLQVYFTKMTLNFT